jgi:predicted enzyme related to lactoylglutathione lyase
MNKVAHFEIPADDKERAKKFYASVFGWQISDWPMSNGMVYTAAQTVVTDEKTMIPTEPGAINGAIVERSKETPTPILTMSVDSVDAYIKKVEASGGKAMSPKGEVPDMGFYAYVKDSEGNMIGLWEDMKK